MVNLQEVSHTPTSAYEGGPCGPDRASNILGWLLLQRLLRPGQPPRPMPGDVQGTTIWQRLERAA